MSSAQSDDTGKFLYGAAKLSKLLWDEMPDNCYHCRRNIQMHHPEPQAHYNPGKVQTQVQPIPFRAVSQIDARETCVQLSPTFIGHLRKVFIKCFALSGRGREPATQEKAGVALWSAQLLPHLAAVSAVERGVWSKLTDTRQPNPPSRS